MFKFIHAADLHLDSPLRGLDRYEGAPVDAIRHATRRAVENLVDLAIVEEVAFVLIAGDIYDGDWRDYNTGLFFVRQMSKLKAAGIEVFLIRGNHDAESVITKSLKLPDNVRTFPSGAAETRFHEATNSAIHGQSFAKRAVTADLSARYPDPEASCFNIGLLHTSAAGYADHETYAPCSVDGLVARGYSYWALGHVHKGDTLHEHEPHIAFSGNTQGRHMRETGPKGCELVTVDGDSVTSAFCPLDVFRWEHLKPNAAGCEHPDDVLAVIANDLRNAVSKADGRPTAARIEVSGRSESHAAFASDPERWEQEVRAVAAGETGDAVWIEKVKFRTTPPGDFEDLSEGPLAELRKLLADVESDDALLQAMSSELADLQKVPREVRDFLLRECPGAKALDDATWLRPLVADAGRLLLGRLMEEPG